MSDRRANINPRGSSRGRPLPPLPNDSSVSSISRSIQSGSMNLTGISSRTREIRQNSIDRTKNSTTQKKTSNDARSFNQTRTIDETDRNYTNGTTNNELYDDDSDQNKSNNYNSTTTMDKNEQLNSSSIDQHLSPSLELKLKQGGLTGLQNLGNTCFMNSVLQCLSNTKPLLLFCFKENLMEYFNTSSTSVMKGVLMREYANLIRKMWTSSDGYSSMVSPSAFKSTIGRFAPRFLGYAQQDSQEFLRYLLQGLHEDVNRVRQKPSPIKIDEKLEEKLSEQECAERSWNRCLHFDNSPIVDIFAGQLKSTLECTHCHHKSITFDMFWDLSIPLPRYKSLTSVQECIQLFMSKEELDGNEKPRCSECKQKRRCTKKFSIQKCPDILVLHLKRFSQARSRSKLDTHVDFPIDNLKLDDLIDVMSESNEGSISTYSLFGVSNHSGTAYFGHYTAQCKHPFTNLWHEFNDSNVYKLNDKSRIISSSAYVLFYERNRS